MGAPAPAGSSLNEKVGCAPKSGGKELINRNGGLLDFDPKLQELRP